MLETYPQLVHVIWYDRDVVNTGTKKSVNLVARSSRWWWTKERQYWQVAGLPGSAFSTVLKPKRSNMGVSLPG
jgi:hypothetical protein